MKRKPLTKEEHEAIGRDIKKFSLEFWEHYQRIQRASGKSSPEAKLLYKSLNIMTSKLCSELDNKWYSQGFAEGDENNPYYGEGKIAVL